MLYMALTGYDCYFNCMSVYKCEVAKLGSKAGNYLSGKRGGGGNETERQRDRETERQRDRETERQRDRETERQRDRETERQRDRETERQTDRETERQTDR